MKTSKRLLTAAVLSVAMLFTGCGKAEEVVLADFTSEDGTISIQMNESWKTEDMGTENWLAAFNEEETEGIVALQLPKALYAGEINDMDDVKEMVEDSFEFEMSGTKEVEGLTVPGLSGLTTYSGAMTVEDVKGQAIVVYGETDYAFYSILYAAPKINKSKTEYFKNVCASFKETEPVADEIAAVPITDTIRWFNGTYAVLTRANGWDYNLVGGVSANTLGESIMQSMLDEWWEVTDKESADETMEWLLGEGHRVGFVDNMLYLEESGIKDVPAEGRKDFVFENFEVNEQEAQNYADWYNAFEEKGENAIAAWDYSRAMSLLGYYYLAGFYTQTDALDASYDLATFIQQEFDSWESFMESYMIGYEYWAEEGSEERREIYEEIKAASDSPYNLDWNLTFEKSW